LKREVHSLQRRKRREAGSNPLASIRNNTEFSEDLKA